MQLYSECHAVQIELLFCYHIIDKVTDFADFMKTDVTKILDKPYEKNELYKDCAINFMKNPSFTSFHYIKTAYMYSYATSLLLSQLLEEDIRSMNFLEPYSDKMNQITKLLSTLKYTDIPSEDLLVQLGNLDEDLNLMFLSNNT